MEASIRADAVMPFPTLTSFLIKWYAFFFPLHQPQYFTPNISMSVSCSSCFESPHHLSAQASLNYLLLPLQSRGTKRLIEKLGHAAKTEDPFLLAHSVGATNPVFQSPGYGQNLTCWNFIWPRIRSSSNRKHPVCLFHPQMLTVFLFLPLVPRRLNSPLVCPLLWLQTMWTCRQPPVDLTSWCQVEWVLNREQFVGISPLPSSYRPLVFKSGHQAWQQSS